MEGLFAAVDPADGTVTRVDLLRPAGWEQVMAQGPDGRRTIHLELPEMGVSGEAEVLAVSPYPPLELGAWRVVTGSFRNERNHGLRALHVSMAGEVSCLRVTSGHPVWSVTRGAWIGAGELVPARKDWRSESEIMQAILRLCGNQSYAKGRQNIVLMLGDFGGQKEATALGDLLMDTDVQGHAIRALWKLRDNRFRGSVERLIPALQGWSKSAAKKYLSLPPTPDSPPPTPGG